jgi:AraC family transcriptional regulator of adaptative response / DNA-3-methyladenine glycosylase II
VQEGAAGSIAIRHLPARESLEATIRVATVEALPAIVARIRRVFDLGADIATIGAHLAQDPALAPLIAARPGLRAPGGWDGFELAVRAVLGQQVTLVAARRLAAQLVRLCGTRLSGAISLGLTHAFPDAAQVAAADLDALGMPQARKAALAALAAAALADPFLFEAQASVEDTVARLRMIRGVGEWTAQYIALRAARESDAFPASDVGLLRGGSLLGGLLRGVGRDGVRPSPAELAVRAEPWRPWRAYAAQHLWAADAAAQPGAALP